MKVAEKRTYTFLLILTIFSTVVFQLWRTLFNNFSVENYRLLEAKDVHPGIVKRVEAGAEGYFENGIDPKEIQVSTVI